MLSGLLVMGQAAFLDGQVFNLSPSLNDDVVPAEVGIGRRDVAEALVVTAVVVGLIFSPQKVAKFVRRFPTKLTQGRSRYEAQAL